MEKENPAMSKNTGAKFGSFLQNIGSKAGTLLKGFAVFVLVIGIISSIYMGIQTAISGDTVINRSDYFSEYNAKIKAQFRAAGFTTLIGGCIGSVFASLLILAFGQLVDEHIQIRKIMERQAGLQNDPESEDAHAEIEQDESPEPQVQYEFDDTPEPQPQYESDSIPEPPAQHESNKSFTMNWPQWTNDGQQPEDILRARWRRGKEDQENNNGKDKQITE